MSGFNYSGQDLAFFQHAVNWKRYWSAIIRPFVTGRVLDVGAGWGDNAGYLESPDVTAWCFLEPDAALLLENRLRRDKDGRGAPKSYHGGTIATLPPHEKFDTILYIDVLEHIQNDRLELQRAARHLKTDGHLVVLAPALPVLFSDFDRSIGHYRRYTRQRLRDITPERFSVVKLLYVDAVGTLASLANRLLLKNTLPTRRQIGFWDRVMIPVSRIVDPILSNRIGKTLCCVWARPN